MEVNRVGGMEGIDWRLEVDRMEDGAARGTRWRIVV